MSLRQVDVERIETAGHRGFFFEDDEGYRRLRNVDGHCTFLDGGRCVVYPVRPEGCVLYPMILFTDCNEVGLDDFCPHRHEFRFGDGDRSWLVRSIEAEDEEARGRRAGRQKKGSGPGGPLEGKEGV